MRLAAALLVLMMLTVCFVGGTLAKYTSSADGSSTATVAKWSITLNDNKELAAANATVTFNLFTTINDTDATNDETDVKDNLIAPGTAGSFELSVLNASEVTAKYSIALAESANNTIPLQYSLDGTTWVDSIAELTMTALTEQTIEIGQSTANTHTVHWRWLFEGTATGAHKDQTDATDTALGIAAQSSAPTVTITATITATQVD